MCLYVVSVTPQVTAANILLQEAKVAGGVVGKGDFSDIMYSHLKPTQSGGAYADIWVADSPKARDMALKRLCVVKRSDPQ